MWARKFSPFISSIFMGVFTKHPGLDFCKNKLFIPEGNLYAIYFEQSELDQVIKTYTKTLEKADMSQYALWYEGEFKKFLDWTKKQTATDFTKLSNQQLADVLEQLSYKLDGFSEIQFCAFLVLEGIGRELESRFAQQPEVLQSISSTYKTTKISQAQIDLLKLVINKKADKQNLQKHLAKYNWIPVYDFVDKPLVMKDLINQIKHIKDAKLELKNITHHNKQGLARYKKLMNSTSDQKIRKCIEIVHYFSYLKEMRDDYRRHAYYLWSPFWQELSKRLDLTIEESNCLTEKELIAALTKGKKVAKTAKNRIKKFAIRLNNGKLEVYSGKDTQQIEGLVIAEEGESVKGYCAAQGFVKGRVNLIYHRGEFNKFKNNDILVTTMTHPEFLPIMKKAKAIITDEGGITCHAAIVSRELGIPCIIGTKHATKLLKDGDMVEVDANRGIVKKIN